jgi:hypothetical protein
MLALSLLPQPQPWGRLLPIRICRFGCAGNVYVFGARPRLIQVGDGPQSSQEFRGEAWWASVSQIGPAWINPERQGDFRVLGYIASWDKAR